MTTVNVYAVRKGPKQVSLTIIIVVVFQRVQHVQYLRLKYRSNCEKCLYQVGVTGSLNSMFMLKPSYSTEANAVQKRMDKHTIG